MKMAVKAKETVLNLTHSKQHPIKNKRKKRNLMVGEIETLPPWSDQTES